MTDDSEKHEKDHIFLCCHCGNVVMQQPIFRYDANLVFEEIDHHECREPYTFVAYKCSTCTGLTLTGSFDMYLEKAVSSLRPILYPLGPFFDPKDHTVSPRDPVPKSVTRLYGQAWPLRYRAPAAFANQVLRTLELICADQRAVGNALHEQLQDLE